MMLDRTKQIAFAVESFVPFYREAIHLFKLHWQEVAPYQDLLMLNPNLDLYQQMEARKGLVTITARAQGIPVGYIVMAVNPHLHYRHVLIGTDDIHFFHPDYRDGWTTLEMFKVAEAEMRSRGVKIVVFRTKVAKNHGVLFERLGYTPLDIVYSKRLDGD